MKKLPKENLKKVSGAKSAPEGVAGSLAKGKVAPGNTINKGVIDKKAAGGKQGALGGNSDAL